MIQLINVDNRTTENVIIHITGKLESSKVCIARSKIDFSEIIALRQLIRKMILKTTASDNMFLQSENTDIYLPTSDKQAKDVAQIIAATKATHKLLGNIKLVIVFDLLIDSQVDVEKQRKSINAQTGVYLNTSSIVNLYQRTGNFNHFDKINTSPLAIVRVSKQTKNNILQV